MTAVYRAQIANDYLFGSDGIHYRIGLVDVDDRGYPVHTVQRLIRVDGSNHPAWHVPTEEERLGATSPTRDDPSIFYLPEGCGEALLDALLRHFRGISPDAQLAALLSHEQDRRDKLEEALIRIAQGGSHVGTIQLQERR